MNAQYCGKQTYSFSDGLNQPHSYSLVDSKGRLWVDSRGGGINMFDGKRWTNFTHKDGLTYSWGKPIYEDKEGGIWITHSYQKGASRYINNTFTQYVMPSANLDSLKIGQYLFPFIKDIPYFRYNSVKDELVAFNPDTTGQIWIYPFDFETKNFATDGIPFFSDEQLTKNTADLDRVTEWRYLINDSKGNYQLLFFQKNGGLVAMDRAGNIELILQKDLVKPSVLQNCIFQNDDGSFAVSYIKQGQLFLQSKNTVSVIPTPSLKQYGSKNAELELEFHQWGIHSYFITQDANKTIVGIWRVKNSGFKNSYVLAEYNTHTFEIINTLLFSEDKNIGIVTKDKAGTYWYCNGSNQVRLFPNQHWIPSGFQGMPPEAWSVGQTGDHKMWFGSYNKDLVNYDGSFIQQAKNKTLKDQVFMDGNETDEAGNLYFTTMNGILKFNGAEAFEFLAEKKLGFFLNRNRTGELLLGSQQEGLWILPNNKKGNEQVDWKRIDQSKGVGLLNIITAQQDHQGKYWMGRGSQGLAIYFPEQDTVYNWIKETDPNHYGVQSMDVDKFGNIWLGTDKGLCFFDQSKYQLGPDFDFQKHLVKVGLDYTDNSIVQVCKFYDEHTLIVGNGIGYFLIDLNSWYDNPRQLNIKSITEETGHPAGGVIQNAVFIDHRKDIWLMCDNGAVRYSPSERKADTAIPEVIIDQVFVGDKQVTDLSEHLNMSSTDRNITLNFHAATNTDILGNINYRYRLNPDDEWSELIETDHINFYNLSAADYNFEVIAERNGYQSLPAKYTFEIDTTLLQKPLFYILPSLFLFAVGLSYISGTRQLDARQKAIDTITKEKEALQIQTIVNQLNPHFINNALQWLQIRLDRNEDEEAVNVVGKLSENISTVFKNSRLKKAFHPLPDELKLVQNYLYIQKKRFGNNIDYEMPDKSICHLMQDIHTPLLFVQIHVENAVEHGIRNKTTGGKVVVACNQDDDYVYIYISDDGVGRKTAKKIGSHGTQNGLAMLAELMEIYNKQNELKLTQEFVDDIYTSEHGIPYGTKVILKIPKSYNYTI